MQKGIEANLDQIKAIVDIQFPRSMKEIQNLTGKRQHLVGSCLDQSISAKPYLMLLNKTRGYCGMKNMSGHSSS